ncbi:MAG: CBS domain-containing protein [Novosphingobium sp.]
MTIGRLLDGRPLEVVTCAADASVAEAVAILAERRIGALPVVENGEVIGIFSERDIVYSLSEQGASVLERQVRDVMTSPPVTVGRDTTVLAALSLITRRRVRHLPVMEGGAMIGFISIGDLVKFRIDSVQSEAEAMRSYIQSA